MSDRFRSRKKGKIVRAALFPRVHVEALDARYLMSLGAGNPDDSFAGTGSLTIGTDLSGGSVVQVVSRGDGLTYVLTNLPSESTSAGSLTLGAGRAGGFALSRFTSGGALDTSFGTEGRFIFNFNGGAEAVSLIDAGAGNGFFIAGTAYTPYESSGELDLEGDLLLVRVSDAGAFRPLNGSSGPAVRTYDLNGASSLEMATDAAVNGSGQITFVASYAATSADTAKVAFLRVGADGTPDSTFGNLIGDLGNGAFADAGLTADRLVRADKSLYVESGGAFYLALSPVSPGTLTIRKYVAAGDYDSSFGTSGTINLTTGVTSASAALAVGGSDLLAVAPSSAGVKVFALDPITGSANTNFGFGGSTSYDQLFGANTFDFDAVTIEIDASTGQAVIAARGIDTNSSNSDQVHLFRLTTSGSIDTGFNGGSPLNLNSVSGMRGAPVLVSDNTGRAVLGVPVGDSAGTAFETAVLALDSSGTIDSALNIIVPGIDDAAPTIVRASVASPAGGVFSVYTSESPSTGSVLGVQLTDRFGGLINSSEFVGDYFKISVANVIARPGGGYLVVFSAADSANGPELLRYARYNSNGTLNTTFGVNGVSTNPGGFSSELRAMGAVLDSSNRIVVVGTTSGGARFITRASLTGDADTTFGAGGLTETGLNVGAYYSVAVDSTSGKIYAVGSASNGSNQEAHVDRYTSGGVLDTTWGSGGEKVITISGFANAYAKSVLVLPAAGRLFLGGLATNSQEISKSFLTQLSLADASVVTSFGSSGFVTSSTADYLNSVNKILSDPKGTSGQLIVLGTENGRPSIRRYSSAGVIDTAYATDFTPSTDVQGEFLGAATDAAGRVIAFGRSIQTTTAPSPGVVMRFRASVSTPISVSSFVSARQPRIGELLGEVTVTFTPQSGLLVDEDTLANAVKYIRPNSSVATASLVKYVTGDDGRSIIATYSYKPSSGSFVAGSAGTYTFVLAANVLKDDSGVSAVASDTTMGTAVLSYGAASAPGNPNLTTYLGGTYGPGSVADVQRDASGNTFVLTNLPQIDYGETVGGLIYDTGALVVTKLTPTGMLDTTFGDGGRLIFTRQVSVRGVKMVLGPSGSLYIAGEVYRYVPQSEIVSSRGITAGGGEGNVLIIKLTSAGALDSSFGAGNGWMEYDPSGREEHAVDLALDSQQRVILYGTYDAGDGFAPFFQRTLADGTPDASFGNSSLLLSTGATRLPDNVAFTHSAPGSGGEDLGGIAVTSDDGFLVAGRLSTNAFAASLRIDSTGNYDSNFGVRIFGPFQSVGIDVKVVGTQAYFLYWNTSSGNVFVSRFNAISGATDSSYGTTGTTSYSGATSTSRSFGIPNFAVTSSGEAYVAAYTFDSGEGREVGAIFSFTSTGAINTAFNSLYVYFVTPLQLDEQVYISDIVGSGFAAAADGLQLQGDFGAESPAVASVQTNGLFDSNFNAGSSQTGVLIMPDIQNASVASAKTVVVGPNGSIFTAAIVKDIFGRTALETTLLDRDGVVVRTVRFAFGIYEDLTIAGAHLIGNNYYVLFSGSDTDLNAGTGIFAARFAADGSRDNSFGSSGVLRISATDSVNRVAGATAVTSDGSRIYFTFSGTGDDGFVGFFNVAAQTASLSTTPLSSGSTTTPSAITVDPSTGLVYAAFSSFSDFARDGVGEGFVVRLQADLTLDTTFASAGYYSIAIGGSDDVIPLGLTIDPTLGRLLVTGQYATSADEEIGAFIFALKLADEAADSTFGDGGLVTELSRGFLDGYTGLVIDPAGGYIVVGARKAQAFIGKCSTAGVFDETYAQYSTFGDGLLGRFNAVALNALGQPIAVGEQARTTGGPLPAVVSRFNFTQAPPAPTAGFSAGSTLAPTFGNYSFTFTVTYTPANGVVLDLSTLTSSAVSALLGGSAFGSITLVSTTAGANNSVIATFRFDGTFSLTTSGTLEIVQTNTVLDEFGQPVASSTLASSSVSFAPVTSSFTMPNTPALGAATLSFSYTFTAGTGRTLNSSSLSGATVIVTLPDGSTVVLTPSTVNQISASVAILTFTLPAPGGTFGGEDAGLYTVAFGSAVPVDDLGSPAVGSGSDTFTLQYSTPSTPSAGSLSVPTPTLSSTILSFTVQYTPGASSPIDTTTFGNDDVLVTFPDGTTALAEFVSFEQLVSLADIVSFAADAAPGGYVVTYRFAPKDGVFSSASNGTYSFAVLAGGVEDLQGTGVVATTLGTLVVNLSGGVGTAVSVSAPGGSFLPGANIFPSAVVNNPSTASTQAFQVRFFLRTSTGDVLLGSATVLPMGAGETQTVIPPAGIPLPPTTIAPPGSYFLVAQVFDFEGNAFGAAVVSANQVTVAAPVVPRPGKLDPNFGDGDGIVTTYVPGPVITIVGSVAAATGNLVYSGGYSSDGDLVLMRFNSITGELDRSFGINGIQTYNIGGATDVASTFVGDQQGRMILGGTSQSGSTNVFTILRFNADGTLDTSFATAGRLSYTPSGSQASILRSITIDRFGRPYLLGSILARQSADGAIAPQGVVIRLSPSGIVDSTFGSLGVISAAFTNNRSGVIAARDGTSELTSLRLLDDRIVVGGFSGPVDGSASRFLVAALRYDGSLDTRYGAKGLYLGALGSSIDRITVLQETSKGTIYVGGSRGTSTGNSTASSTTALLFRLTASGKLDRSFNKGQIFVLNTGTTFGTVSSLTNSVNDTILVTVATSNSLADASAGRIGTVAFRLTPGGINDPLFNGGAPLIVFDTGLVLTAVSDVVGNFDQFVQSKQGAATQVQGGLVQAYAARPTSDSTGTALSVAQLSPDGVDLLPTLTSTVTTTIRPGQRLRLNLLISNLGSIASSGRFTLAFTTSGPAGLTLPTQTLSARIAAGGSKSFRLSILIPRNATAGTYTLTLTLNGVTFTDVNASNNTAGPSDAFTISPPPSRNNRSIRAALTALALEDKERPSLTLFSQQPILA